MVTKIWRNPLLWTCAVLMSNAIAHADEGPAEVMRLINTVETIPGVEEANVGKIYLPDVNASDLSLPGVYADLPIAAIRRTNGGLPDELLLSIDFSIFKDQAGLKALEFLAWWVRDQSRSGENMQLRAIGLPPMAGETKQLGETLRFTIDWFYVNPAQDIDAVLKALDEASMGLEQAFDIYAEAFH